MAFEDLPAPHASTHAPAGSDPLAGSYAALAGGNSFSGTQTFGGKLIATAASKLGAYTVTATAVTLSINTHKYVELTTAAALPTLQTASGAVGYDFYLINTYTSAITLTANGTDKIGNTASAASTFSIPAGSSLHIVSTGTAWRIL